jgi:ComF family protein
LLREFITRLKYSGERKLAAPLGALLADAAQELLTLPEYDVIVPVPLFRDRLRERGFNQAFLLARPLALLARIPVVHGLERIVNTTAQVGLHGAARRQNVRDAFALHPRRRSEVVRRTVLLVDDVITTGATADECARVLKAAGCKRVDVIGLARTP